MRVLLDTHAFLWWLDGDKKLGKRTKAFVDASPNQVVVSAASVWEITTKYRNGKLPKAAGVAADVPAAIAKELFSGLPVTLDHAQLAGSLPGHHNDPFDRMLIAQAILENMQIASNEVIFDLYGAVRIW